MPANGRWDLIRRLKVKPCPWSRAFLEKLVPQPVKKFPVFYLTPKVNYCVHNSTLLDPIVSQTTPAHSLTPLSLVYYYIFPSMPRSSKHPLHITRVKNSVCVSTFVHIVSRLSHSPYSDIHSAVQTTKLHIFSSFLSLPPSYE